MSSKWGLVCRFPLPARSSPTHFPPSTTQALLPFFVEARFFPLWFAYGLGGAFLKGMLSLLSPSKGGAEGHTLFLADTPAFFFGFFFFSPFVFPFFKDRLIGCRFFYSCRAWEVF